MNEIAPAVLVSLTVSFTATVLCAGSGIPLGCVLSISRFRGKAFLLNLLSTLQALPTVVVGLLVYALIRREGVLGNLGLLFTPGAMVLGEVVLALPLTISFAHSACSSVDRAACETARTLGASRFGEAAAVISEARYGILAAVAATFGRLIGEVGVAMMLGGNIAGYTRSMTTAMALETSKGEFAAGMKLGLILLSISLIVNMLLRMFQEPATAWRWSRV